MKILLVGGGSGGPAAPLLAVASHIKKHHPMAEFLFVGTKTGPERLMAERAGFRFCAITSGKWRRYFAWENLLAPFLVFGGFIESWKILESFRPDCVLGSGSFVQVPLVWAAKFKKVPVVLHQQDVIPNLANKLCELAADKITVTFPRTLKNFPSNMGLFYHKTRQDKIHLTGNPFREELHSGSRERAMGFFGLSADYPTLLVLGGGTGADFLNNLITDALPQLSKTVQIIHSTGAGKLKGPAQAPNYHAYEFIDNMGDAYAAADIVLARAGISTLTELSNLKKLGIIIPLPQSPQLANALLLKHANASVILDQSQVSPAGIVALVRRLLFVHEFQQALKANIGGIMPKEAAGKISEIILNLASQHG